MTDLTADVLGWIGAVALLAAYGVISARRMTASSMGYQGLNVVGAMGLIVNSTWYGAYPSTALNVVWIAIGAVTLAGVLRKKKDSGTADRSPSSP